MNLTVHFHGIMADWVGTQSATIDLPSSALLADLMDWIGRQFRQKMPEQLWDDEKNTFKKHVMAVRNGTPLKSMETTLADGEEVTFYLMLSGG